MRRSYRPLSPLSYLWRPGPGVAGTSATPRFALPLAAGVDRAAGGACACSAHDFVERSDVLADADLGRLPAHQLAHVAAIGDVGDVGQLTGGDQRAVAPENQRQPLVALDL